MRSLSKKLKHGYIRAKSYVGRPRTVMQLRPVIVSDSTICANPIFIIGVHRSGTSLLRRIINSHPNICCPPETYFLTHFAAMLRDQQTFAGLYGFGYHTHTDCINQLRLWAGRYHEAYRIATSKKRWADKTPQYSFILEELREIFGEKAQFVFLFRHPLDVIYSLYGRGWDHGSGDSDRLTRTARYVAETVRLQLDFLVKYDGACLALKYEELIEDAEASLKTMLDFLCEPWDSRVLEYHTFDHNYGVEDPVVRGAVGFFENTGNWKAMQELQVEKAVAVVGDCMNNLGYTVHK
jgi:hypothetical protein